MRAKFFIAAFSFAAGLGVTGSFPARAGQETVPRTGHPHGIARVTPGVTSVSTAPYAGDGQVAIRVQWIASQKQLEHLAQWWIEQKHDISSTTVLDTGKYTIHFGRCTVKTFTPPTPRTYKFTTSNKITTLIVRYGHR